MRVGVRVGVMELVIRHSQKEATADQCRLTVEVGWSLLTVALTVFDL